MNSSIFLAIGLFSLGFAYAGLPRIIGGVETAIEDVPYQAELEAAKLGIFWGFACGAVIVGPNSVLTTATCVYNIKPENLRIRAGSAIRGDGNIHKAVNVTIHPNNTDFFDNDLAFITVDPRFIFHSGVKAVPIATYEPQPGKIATVSGWGVTSVDDDKPTELLQKASVPIVNRTACAESYGDVGNVTTGMICAGFLEGGIDSCSGDTGGPLQIDDVLIGLVSWGYGCAKPGYPAVYTNVPVYQDWIKEQIDASTRALEMEENE